MNTQDYISTLCEAEQRALAICGITKAAQLATCRFSALCVDAERAREFFPEEMAALTQERLQAIFRIATEQMGAPAETTETPQLSRLNQPASPATDTPASGDMPLSSPPRAKSKIDRRYSKSHCIPSRQPVRTYLSALLVVLFYLDCAAWLIVPTMLYIGLLPTDNAALVLTALALPPVLYFVVCTGTVCTVCKVRYITKRGFAYSRYAHKWPLLGTPLSTALHILLFLWFHCPACGTPQSIFRRRKRH
ncbi:MAG: hypothetical protein IJN29_12180 [Akkermansia sp.]|nr:hypothetical protein [Akkermansia sp.]